MRSFDAEVRAALRSGARRVCDVGAGANPAMALEDIKRHGVEYSILDASRVQLAKAPRGYLPLVADIDDACSVERVLRTRGPFDLVVSRWTAEHVPHGERFHAHIRRLLAPGATAVHLFSTLYSPVFVVNRALPQRLRTSLVARVDRSGREPGSSHESFRPYYSWCRGPTRAQVRRLARLGFSVRRYVGFFGHPYYARWGPWQAVNNALSGWLLHHPRAVLTSYALVVLQRDGDRVTTDSRRHPPVVVTGPRVGRAVESSPSTALPKRGTLPQHTGGAGPERGAVAGARDRHPVPGEVQAALNHQRS